MERIEAAGQGQAQDVRTDPVDVVSGVLKMVVGFGTDRVDVARSVSAELAALVERAERVRDLGGPFQRVEVSPYVAHMLKLVGREALVEALPAAAR